MSFKPRTKIECLYWSLYLGIEHDSLVILRLLNLMHGYLLRIEEIGT